MATVHEGNGTCLFAISIRIVHTGWNGLCWACGAGGRHRNSRPRVSNFHVEETRRGVQIAQVVAVCAKVVRCPVGVTLGKTQKEGRITFGNMRGANKETHSCHFCSIWPSTTRERPDARGSSCSTSSPAPQERE